MRLTEATEKGREWIGRVFLQVVRRYSLILQRKSKVDKSRGTQAVLYRHSFHPGGQIGDCAIQNKEE